MLTSRGAKCSLQKLNGVARCRKLIKMSNSGGRTQFSVFNSDIKTSLRGVLERLFFVKKNGTFTTTKWPSKVVVHERLMEYKHGIIKRIAKGRKRVQQQTIVAMYTGSKRRVYENAAKSLNLRPVCKADSYLQTFIKIEKTDFTHKSDPVPRIIQPRHPRYHLELARYLKPIEHDIYLAIDDLFNDKVVAKGKNAVERGRMLKSAWDKFKDPVAIAADAKRFDQHVSDPMLAWEHSIYKQIFKSKHLHTLLSWQRDNRGFCNTNDGTIVYTIKGCRMSGDINTALGNVIIMCGMFYSYLQNKPYSRFINDGDDCVLLVERDTLDQFDDLVDYFEELGFTMELDEPVDMLEHVDFCQCRPVQFKEGYRMIRNFEPCLTKDLHTTKSIDSPRAMMTQLKSISMCGLSIASDCPVYGSFYSRMLRENDEGKVDANPEKDGKFWLSQRMPKLTTQVLPVTRSSFAIAFGISPKEQLALEEVYSQVEYPYVKCVPFSTAGFD